MRLDEDAGVLLVDFAHLFAGGDGFFDSRVEVGGLGDASAVAADVAEGGELAAVGSGFAGLALALEGHGEQERERVLARAAVAEEDERVREATGGDGGAEAVDRGAVADELVEVLGEGHGF